MKPISRETKFNIIVMCVGIVLLIIQLYIAIAKPMCP